MLPESAPKPGVRSSGVRYGWSMVGRGFGSRQILALPLTSCRALGKVTNLWESQLISKMGMVISHSKGFWVNYHERTCVKSSVQSLAHSGCSINEKNVFDDAVVAAPASLCPREPLTVKAGFLPALPTITRLTLSSLLRPLSDLISFVSGTGSERQESLGN